MTIAALVLAIWFQAQDQTPVVLNAGLGGCSAEFTVTGADGAPAYLAVIRTRVRYGFMSVKRMDLEVSTGPDGKARIQGLPAKGKPVEYSVFKGPEKGAATQDLEKQCNSQYSITLQQ